MLPAGAAAPGAVAGDVVLRLAGVRKTFRHAGSAAVDGIDLEVRRGEFFTLLGPSGSGKTTTLRLIAGFERPDAGTIELEGTDVARIPPYDRNVNTVFQDYALFPHLSVADNVGYGLKAKGVPAAQGRERVDEALRTVQMQDFGARLPAQLSGGQRQRIGLARAIVNRPGLLLLDEPLGALDLKLRRDMQAELKAIQEQVGLTFLYVTHDQEEALSMSSRVALFRNGRIEQRGTPRDLYDRPASAFVAAFMGTSVLLRREGRCFVMRPEKVRLLAPAAPVDPGLHVEDGILREAVFVGMATRFVVRLADGTDVEALELNAGGRFAGDTPRRGSPVRVGWKPDDLWRLDEAG